MANYLLIRNVEEALERGDTQSATDLLNDTENSAELKNNAWDLVPIIAKYLSDEHRTNNELVFKCCESLLLVIAQRSNPEETILQFIDEIEETQDDTKLKAFLNPLKYVLCRIPSKRIHSLAWCLNAIQTFANKYEIPDYREFSGKEKLLVDSEPTYQRITILYKESLLPFYKHLIENLKNEFESICEIKAVVCKFLIQLLGKPLGYLDFEILNDIKGTARIIAEDLVCKILKINRDPILYLEHEEINEMTTPNDLGVAVLFYLIYGEHFGIEQVPKVYNGEYIFQYGLQLLYTLYNEENSMMIEKGLKLGKSIINYGKGKKLPYQVLDHDNHRHFCKSLSNIIIYNSIERNRKEALEILKLYLTCFDKHATYLLIYNLIENIEHNGLKSYITSYYKDMLAQEFVENEHNFSQYFKGPKLLSMLRKFCYLPKNEETDLVENSNQIIATLNLLRYLTIRDKANITSIWDNIKILESIYLDPLRKGIRLSVAHYELRVKEVKEESKKKRKQQTEVSVKVGGKDLPYMSDNEKLKVLHSSMTALDIIDSLLSRLVECIEVNTNTN